MTPLDTAIAEAARSGGPAGIALMRILAEAETEAEARAGLIQHIAVCDADSDAGGAAYLRGLLQLWEAHPQAWHIVRSTLKGVAHEQQGTDPDQALNAWAAVFDRLAIASPEASVALYSLGSPELLAAATAEIVALTDRLHLLGPTRDAIDVGCGIGRLAVALAPRMRSLRGFDIAERMVAEAQRRTAHLPNVDIRQSSGRDLAGVADRSCDLILAADVFPYLVQAGGGLARRHFVEFARVLRPGGGALILNYSYRGDLDADREDVTAAAQQSGLAVERLGEADLDLWDAATFLLRRPFFAPGSTDRTTE